MKGTGDIPALRLEVLNKVIQKMPTANNLFFMNLFSSQQYDSDTIRWILEYGTSGMTPFVSPGAPAPTMGDEGLYSEGSARAAYWKEKVFLDETMLNNLREPLTQAQYYTAERQLARQQRRLRNRCTRRREWMVAKMLFDGVMSYQRQGAVKFTVNYGIPSNHKVTLTGDDVWWDSNTGEPGSTASPIQDIYDARKTYREDVGSEPEYTVMNSDLLQTLIFNPDLMTLLQKSAFGEGDLFNNPEGVLGRLLGVGQLRTYDEIYEISAWLTQDASGGGNTLYVDDAIDFEAETDIRIFDMDTPFDYEEHTISSVDKTNNTITIKGTLSQKYEASKDRVVMRKKFITDDKLMMFRQSLDGEDIAEVMEAPFGNDRHFGMYVDRKEEWDPEGVWLRVQNKGLPVLYHPDAIYTMTVR